MLETLESRMMLSTTVRFAAIGDFGAHSAAEHAVAQLVRSWHPDFIITTGDNNYPNGAAATLDGNVGADYHCYIYPYRGRYGAGSADHRNHFFPTLGNHDYMSLGAQPYLKYFKLPGNSRYYSYRLGPVEVFAIDSNPENRDLHYTNARTSTASSREGKWLRKSLAASTAQWKIVYFHHPPFSSGTTHGSSAWMRWPFKQWGATAVISGHEHNYERLIVGGMPYFVDGSGGDSLYPFGKPLKSSRTRYSAEFGAMRVSADESAIIFKFISIKGKFIDQYTIAQQPTVSRSMAAIDNHAS